MDSETSAVGAPGADPELDLIDRLAGLGDGSAARALREVRPEARERAQGAFRALFEPTTSSAESMSLTERLAVALYVAGLHRDTGAAAFYAELLRAHSPAGHHLLATVQGLIRPTRVGPYGVYRETGLAEESDPGPLVTLAAEPGATLLGPRLMRALEHAHLLVLHPRDARRDHLAGLEEAGWDATGIVVLSQIVAFLSFQLRVAHGLRDLDSCTSGAA